MTNLGSIILLSTTLLAGAAQGHPPPEGRVQVSWTDPTQMAETRTYNPRHEGPERWLEPLAQHLDQRLESRLEPNERMDVTIVDVLRAGRFEPWRELGWDEVRIFRDNTPPRIELEYRRYTADGKTLDSGRVRLVDSFYQTRSGLRWDPLRHEKTLLDNWVRKTIVPHKDTK